MKIVDSTTLKHRVGTCPACRDYLWAEVTVETSVGVPAMNDEGKAFAYVTANPVAMTFAHQCDRRDELEEGA